MSVFTEGSQWVKIDLHLHTKSDKEFKYPGNNFDRDFVDKLKEQGIKIAAITNHNKFNYEEFKELYKLAIEEGIWLLPGVELSVNEGKYGVHALIIFDDKEILKKDFINGKLIPNAFYDREPFDSNNSPLPCRFNLKELIDELDKLGQGYLLILAHVDNSKGFFKSLNMTRAMEFIPEYRSKIVAFQDINESSRRTFESELRKRKVEGYRNHLPAYVSFSDPKKIEEIEKIEKK